MKIIVRAVCIISLCIAAMGCRPKTHTTLPVVNVQEVKESDDLSQFVHIQQLIVLEEADGGLLIHPDKAFILHDGSMVFKDKGNRILKFSATGSFLGKIGLRGRGPQEYNLCRDITLSRNGKELSVMDLGNILTFNAIDGSFIRRTEIPHHNYDEFCPGPESGFYLFSASPDTEDYSVLHEHNVITSISADGSILSETLPRKDYLLNVALLTRSYKGTTLLRPLEGENIAYELSEAGVRPFFSIDLGSLSCPAGYLVNNGLPDMERYIKSKYYKMALYLHDTERSLYFESMGPHGVNFHYVTDQLGRVICAWRGEVTDPSPTLILTSDPQSFYALVFDINSKISMPEEDCNPLDRIILQEIRKQKTPVNENPLLVKLSFAGEE